MGIVDATNAYACKCLPHELVPSWPPSLRVTDTSGEGFAVRLYKAGLPCGCVRAFSDVPAAFCNFSKAEKVMKALYVSKLYLWPRFHAAVKADLELRQPEVCGCPVK